LCLDAEDIEPGQFEDSDEEGQSDNELGTASGLPSGTSSVVERPEAVRVCLQWKLWHNTHTQREF